MCHKITFGGNDGHECATESSENFCFPFVISIMPLLVS